MNIIIAFKNSTTAWDEIIELRKQLWDLTLDYWLSNTLFSFNWWFLLTTVIVFFIIWIWLVDKGKLLEIMTFGLLISTVVFTLDLIGITMVLWSYPDRLFPIVLPTLEIHKIHMPIIYMLIYQYFQTWKSFTIAIIISATIFAFVLEPFTVWLGIYEIYHWHYMYSWPIYIIIGISLKWIVAKVKHVEKKSKTK